MLNRLLSPDQESCSTFLLAARDRLIVGHNLDDYCKVIGLVVVNKRRIAKTNVSWSELTIGGLVRIPRLRWVSKYGSVTYNTRGKEFPDGGMNEAGLYVGEMNLWGTQYPANKTLPRMYHNQWVQYLLDNFETVEQVLDDISNVIIDGHSLWHFFIADKKGSSAIIEFLEGKAVIYSGQAMPWKVLCNTAYAKELETLRDYDGFEGEKPIPFGALEDGKSRFVRAAALFKKFANAGRAEMLKNAFELLDEIRGDNNQWGVVYDMPDRRMYFRTASAPAFRFVDFSALDFSPELPSLMLDINKDFSGDAATEFTTFSDSVNRENIFQGFRELEKAGLIKKLDPVSRFIFMNLVPKRLSQVPKKFMAA